MTNTISFQFSLKLVHPTTSLDAITAALGHKPDGGYCVGDPRATPAGVELGGIRRETLWHFAYRITATRYFFSECVDFCEEFLMPYRTFLDTFRSTGGEIMVIVNLPGTRNLGDDLAPDQLRRLADLGVSLGVEVFPSMR